MARVLPNKPLTEALIEWRWELPGAEVSEVADPAYPLLVGRVYDRVRKTYPAVERLPASVVPDQITKHIPKIRFRRAPDEWPLVQLGPGIATFNVTQDYEWTQFSAAAASLFSTLLESYGVSTENEAPPFSTVLLRYINAIPADPSKEHVLAFLSSKLHTNLKLPEAVTGAVGVLEPPARLNLSVSYQLQNPPAVGTVRLASGFSSGNPALVLDLSLQTTGTDVPKTLDSFRKWLDAAHAVIEQWFFGFIDGELHESFKGEQHVAPTHTS